MNRLALITAGVIAVTWAIVFAAETLRPLRTSRESKLRRTIRNAAVGALALELGLHLHAPFLVPISAWVDARGFGLMNLVAMPSWLRVTLTIILLDYTLWWWHWMSHRVPLLWRFHVVHHVDRDLDASTALRFHFGEHALSFVFRAMQVVVLGASPFSVWLWQAILFASILFHHSNARLPLALERRLVRFIVTPRMHGIHHADVETRTHSNWSSLLSWWDMLHGTFRFDVPDEDIRIGVPAYGSSRDVGIFRILLLPFTRQRDYWRRSE